MCVSKNIGKGMKANVLLGIAIFLGETVMKRIVVDVYEMPAEHATVSFKLLVSGIDEN